MLFSFQQPLEYQGQPNLVTLAQRPERIEVTFTKCTSSLNCWTLRHTDAFRWKRKFPFFHPGLPGPAPFLKSPDQPPLTRYHPLGPSPKPSWRPHWSLNWWAYDCQFLREMSPKCSAGILWPIRIRQSWLKDKQKEPQAWDKVKVNQDTESTKAVARGQSRQNKEGLTRSKSTELPEARNRRRTQEEEGWP